MNRLTERFLLLVWLICSTSTYLYVHLYGLPIPFADEWGMVETAAAKYPITLEWLWSLHNEHRLPLTRLIYVTILQSTQNSVRAVMFFDVIALSAISLALLSAVRKIRGTSSLNDAFIPACVLSLGQYENLIWANQIQFILTAVFLCAILCLVAVSKSIFRFWRLLLIAGCLILLPLCCSAGLVSQIPILVWLLVTSILLFKSGQISPIKAAILFLGIAAAGTITVLYFVNFDPVFLYRSYNPNNVARGSLEFLSTAFGPASIKMGLIFSVACLLIIISTLWMLFSNWQKKQDERLQISGFISLIFAFILTMLVVSVGRSGGGIGTTAAHRYATLLVPTVCTIYFAFTVYKASIWQKAIPIVLILLSLLAAHENFQIATQYGKGRAFAYQRFNRDLQADLPIEALATRDVDAVFPFYDPAVLSFIGLLQEFKIGPFAGRSEPLPKVEGVREMDVSLNGHNLRASTANRLSLTFDQPQHLLGFRPTFIIESDNATKPQLYLSWRYAETGEIRTIRFPLVSSSHEQTYSFWIYDSVNSIELLAANGRFRLNKMMLLVK